MCEDQNVEFLSLRNVELGIRVSGPNQGHWLGGHAGWGVEGNYSASA